MSFRTNRESLIHRETRYRVLLSITYIIKYVFSITHKPSIITHLRITSYIYTYTHTHIKAYN